MASGTIQKLTAGDVGALPDSLLEIKSQTQEKSVASSQLTDVCSLAITNGTWLLIGWAGYTGAFSQAYQVHLRGAGTSRSVQGNTNGGGLSIALIRTVTAPVTLRLSVYQASGNAQTAVGELFAIRIA